MSSGENEMFGINVDSQKIMESFKTSDEVIVCRE